MLLFRISIMFGTIMNMPKSLQLCLGFLWSLDISVIEVSRKNCVQYMLDMDTGTDMDLSGVSVQHRQGYTTKNEYFI